METTTVVLAQPTSKSLRTTVPATIARQFGITVGTELGWDVEARDSRLVLVVKVVETAPTGPGEPSSLGNASTATNKRKRKKGHTGV